jgi:uncharacterized protein (DUF488 family)
MSDAVYTIGHSRHPWDKFLALLRRHGIVRVVDARSRPFSRFSPHFNRERMKAALEAAGIAYEWRGETLGGRPADPRFLTPDGALDRDALWGWDALQADLEAVAARAPTERQALLCAEENPATCHRRTLLTPPLVKRGLEVLHIRGDGRVEIEREPAPFL